MISFVIVCHRDACLFLLKQLSQWFACVFYDKMISIQVKPCADTSWIQKSDIIENMRGDKMRLLIIEDERPIAEVMMLNLKRIGYQCDYAMDGEQGARMVEKQSYDLILLDIMLPKINGYELMEYLYELEIPVIFITAKGSVQERVKGLRMGADDYLVKPFAIDELLARVDNVLRRYHKSMQEIHVLDVTIHTATRVVKKKGTVIPLTKKEFDLLLYLVQNKNIALYRDTMYEKLWREEDYEQTRTLDLHIQRLRKKLNWHSVIQTVYKIGYMLEVPDEIQ